MEPVTVREVVAPGVIKISASIAKRGAAVAPAVMRSQIASAAGWILDQPGEALGRELRGDAFPDRQGEGTNQASARACRITMAARLEREHQ